MERRVEESEPEVHFRWTIGIKFIGLVALASLLAVEWYSEVRSESARLVTELSSLGKAPRHAKMSQIPESWVLARYSSFFSC